MQRLCPKCQNWYSSQLLCPVCNIQLLDPTREDASPRPLRTKNPLATPITGTGRLLLSVLLTQYLFHAARNLWAVTQPDALVVPDDGSLSPQALILLGFQAAALLGSSILVGALHIRPIPLAVASGLLNSGLFLISGVYLRESVTQQLLMGQLILLPLIAIIGAKIGSRIWRAFPSPAIMGDLQHLTAVEITPKSDAPEKLSASFMVSWPRVVIGVVVATLGVFYAGQMREWLVDFSNGSFQSYSMLQSQFINWEIAALFVTLGGGYAGANSRIGLRHGFLTGAITGIMLVFLYQSQPNREYLPFEFWFETLRIRPQPGSGMPPILAGFIFSMGLVFGTLGGWMGAALLPPIVVRRRLSDFS